MTVKINDVAYFQYQDTHFYVSKDGLVYNIKTDRHQKLNTQVLNSYLYVMYQMKGSKKMLYVHKMVAEVFHKVVDGVNYVDHINGEKSDNRSINLRFVTRQENTDAYYEKYRTGLFGKIKRRTITKEEHAEIIRLQKRGWGSFRIGRALGRKAEVIFAYTKRHNLIKTIVSKGK